MAKDWESFKDEYIEDIVQSRLNWFKHIEGKTKSPIECIVWITVVDYSDQFGPGQLMMYPQCKIGKYTVDFKVTYESLDLYFVIECDGHAFHEKTKQQVAKDKERDRFLSKEGYIVLRYSGSEIVKDSSVIADDLSVFICKALEKNIS